MWNNNQWLGALNGSTASSYVTDVPAYQDLLKSYLPVSGLASSTLARPMSAKSYAGSGYGNPYQSLLYPPMTPNKPVSNPFPYGKFYESSHPEIAQIDHAETANSLRSLYDWALGRTGA